MTWPTLDGVLLKKTRKKRKIEKIRKRYKYSLALLKKSFKRDRSKEDYFYIGGFLVYLFLQIYSFTYVIDMQTSFLLQILSTVVFGGAISVPMAMGFVEKVEVSSRTTVSLGVIPNNPEEKDEVRLRLIGCEFDGPIEEEEDFNKWIRDNKLSLVSAITPSKPVEFKPKKGIETPTHIEAMQKTHQDSKKDLKSALYDDSKEERAITPYVDDEDPEKATKEGIKEKLNFKEVLAVAHSRGLKLWRIRPRKSKYVIYMMLPDTPEKVFGAVQEKVRLSYSAEKVRHAEVKALEADPIKTSVWVDGTVVDIELPLFLPYYTKYDLEIWLKTGLWFIPNRNQQSVAAYVKRKTDSQKTEKEYEAVEEERDNAVAGYNRILTLRELERIQRENEDGVFKNFTQKKKVDNDTILVVAIFMFLMYAMGVMTADFWTWLIMG